MNHITIKSSELKAGMVVLAHGMRVRLDHRVTEQSNPISSWSGTVLNRDEVIASGRVPSSFLQVWHGGDMVRDDQWTVQGNDRVLWNVESNEA